jgi:hypothetical protein
LSFEIDLPGLHETSFAWDSNFPRDLPDLGGEANSGGGEADFPPRTSIK